MDLDDLVIGILAIVCVLSIVIGLMGAFMAVFFISGLGASDGSHAGYITAVEHIQGFIYSADIAYVKTSLESTQEDIYCIKDASVKQVLQEASKNRLPVVVYFHNDLIMWKSDCIVGNTIIYNVELS